MPRERNLNELSNREINYTIKLMGQKLDFKEWPVNLRNRINYLNTIKNGGGRIGNKTLNIIFILNL